MKHSSFIRATLCLGIVLMSLASCIPAQTNDRLFELSKSLSAARDSLLHHRLSFDQLRIQLDDLAGDLEYAQACCQKLTAELTAKGQFGTLSDQLQCICNTIGTMRSNLPKMQLAAPLPDTASSAPRLADPYPDSSQPTRPVPASPLLSGPRIANFRGLDYVVVAIDPSQHYIQTIWKNDQGTPVKTLHKAAASTNFLGKPLLITNAGMFEPDLVPKGLYVQDGTVIVPIDTSEGPERETLNFYIKPNGVFFVDAKGGAHIMTTPIYRQKARKPVYATQSGPMLVHKGEINLHFTPNSPNKKIRSGVGISSNGKVVFAMSSIPVCFYEFAEMFLTGFDCKVALYLDGAISDMYVPALGQTQNGGPFGAMIVVHPKPKGK